VAPLPALTGARFFAAISVVFYHYGLHPLGRVVPFLEAPAHIGPAAVSFFYVLSGAVITWGCTGADGLPVRPTRTFWLQRGARILPAYWLALALSVLPESGNQFSASQAVWALQHARLTEIVNVQGRDGEQVSVTVY